MKVAGTLFVALITTLFSGSLLYAHSDDCDAHPDDEEMHHEHCAVFALVPEDAATHVSIASGNWFSAATWNTGTVPGTDARVLIDSGTVVTYNGNSNTEIFTLRVNGTLQFSTGISTKLVVNTLVVDPHGYLFIGSEGSPVSSTVKAEIVFPDQGPLDTEWDPYQFSKGLISHGHTRIYGAEKKAIAALNGNALQGAGFIKLAESPTGWQVGDRLLLPGTYTDKSGNYADNTRYQDEVLVITSISGTNIYFTNEATGGTTLLYNHEAPAGYGLQQYVGNLTRNVVFTTENAAILPHRERAHIMLMHQPDQVVQYAMMQSLGRSDKGLLVDDPVVDEMGMVLSGGSNPRGRYPLHVHRAGRHDYSGMPMVIEGCVVEDTPGWGIINHSSHADIRFNIVFNFKGAAFITEAGDELGNFTRNMAVKGEGLEEEDYLIAIDRLEAFDMGIDGDGFWMKGSNVSLVDNITASCHGIGYSYFSDDDDFTPDTRIQIPKGALENPLIAGTQDSIYSAVIPVRQNSGSVSYNCFGALSFWTHMYNNDNVGDFSRNEYAELTHNGFSVVEDFQFWNCRSQGINLSYSSQIELKDGVLLGDLEDIYINPADGSLSSVNAGYGINSNGVTGQVIIRNNTIAGWQKACVAMRTDNLVNGDGREYNYLLSVYENNVFHTNPVVFFPETGQDEYYYPEYEKFPEYLVLTADNTFEVWEAGVAPISNFSYQPAGGFAVLFDGSLAVDPDSETSNQGNGIAAYRWDFGDGQTGFGSQVQHPYSSAGTYTAALTVYDEKGQSHTFSRLITVLEQPYANQVVQSGMEMGFLPERNYLSNIDLITGTGWARSADWQLENGKAVIYKSNTTRYLAQALQNDHLLRGVVPFSVQAKNLGTGAAGNSLRIELIGINGEFIDQDPSQFNHATAWNHADDTFEKTILVDEEIGMNAYNWQTFNLEADLGEGYQFLILKVYSQGVQLSKADVQGVDNFCLPCVCGIPGGMMEDELTENSALLVWDNVGALTYEVRYKQKGGAWTTTTVENTFLVLEELLPNKQYQWQVRVLCDGTWTGWSTINTFLTPVSGSLCTSPVALYNGGTTESGSLLSWNEVPGALQYKVSYRKTSGGAWTTITTAASSISVTGLLPATTYVWRVSSECSEGWKPYINNAYFTTLSLREAAALNDLAASPELQLYPNPAESYVIANVQGVPDPATIEVYNLQGIQVYAAGLQTPMTIGVQNWPSGMYWVRIVSLGEPLLTKQFMIE